MGNGRSFSRNKDGSKGKSRRRQRQAVQAAWQLRKQSENVQARLMETVAKSLESIQAKPEDEAPTDA